MENESIKFMIYLVFPHTEKLRKEHKERKKPIVTHLCQLKACQSAHGFPQQERTGFPSDEGKLYPASKCKFK